MNYPDELKQEIKRKAGIRPFEKRLGYLKFNGAGKAEMRCPFHDDSTPSFAIIQHSDGPSYNCMGCSAKGDSIKFVQEYDKRHRGKNRSFPDILKELAEDGGVELPEQEKFEKVKYDPVEGANRLPEIEQFLAKRGISMDVAREYGIGVIDWPGVGPMVAEPYDVKGVYKFRAIEKQKNPKDKWRHLLGTSTDNLLFGIDKLDTWSLAVSDLYIAESELDALTLVSHGFQAVSVNSATASHSKDGLKTKEEHLNTVLKANRIFLAFDMDSAGKECAAAFQKVLPRYKTYRMVWPYVKNVSGQKDVGDLYTDDPAGFKKRIITLSEEATKFRTVNGYRYEMLNGPELRRRTIPEPKQLLGPIIREKDIALIYAERGLGKTYIGLGIALSLASGVPFLKWPVEQPQHVLYIDAEMSGAEFRKRFIGMEDGLGSNADTSRFHPMNFDNQGTGTRPDIATAEGREVIDDMLLTSGSRVLVLDNLSCLLMASDNDDEKWLPVNVWLIDLRAQGITTVMIHHAGKNGQQRGISRREDQVNTTMRLRKPDDGQFNDGMHVIVEFTKSRAFYGTDAEPLDVKLITDQNGAMTFSFKPAHEKPAEMFKQLMSEGASQKEIMAIMEIKRSRYFALLKQYREEATEEVERRNKEAVLDLE